MNRKQRRTAAKIDKKQGRTGTPSSAADMVVNKAIAAAQAGALADAERALDEVLARFPNHVEALHQKGMLMARTNRVENGIVLLQRVTAEKPGEALYWNNLSAACLTVERSEEGLAAARKAVEIDPKYAMAWRNLAMASTDLGHHRQSVEALERASALLPKDADLWNRLGLARLELSDGAGAETAFAKAVALDPLNAESLSNLGGIMIKQGRPKEALPHLHKAVEIDPDRFTAALHFGVALSLTDDLPKGLRWLRRATSIKPRADSAWGALADAAIMAGEKAEALDAAKRAAAFAPADAAHRARLQKLEGGDTTASAGVVELDFGGLVDFSSLRTPEPKKTDEIDLSRSLDQIFIR